MTTKKDVAKEAGVSVKTVSRVLNEEDAVKESTCEKVLAVVDALGYRPNIIARGMRTQRTQTFGFASDEIVTSPYADQTLQSAQKTARKQDILLLSVNTAHLRPPLTTMKLPYYDVGVWAVNQLLRLIEGQTVSESLHLKLKCPPNCARIYISVKQNAIGGERTLN